MAVEEISELVKNTRRTVGMSQAALARAATSFTVAVVAMCTRGPKASESGGHSISHAGAGRG